MNNKEYVLFIGLGDWDIPQLEIVKSFNLKSIVTNRNPESKGLKEADISIFADGRDIYKILSAIFELKIQNEILFVYTGTELFTTAAVLSNILSIPYHKTLSSYICEKKHLMSKYFRKAGVKTPMGFSAKSFSEFSMKSYQGNNNKLKWIFKPSDSLSSKGIAISNDEGRNEISFNYAQSFSESNTVICEEFINGSLHDINGILTKDGFYPLGINDKKAGQPPRAVVVEGSAPTVLSVSKQIELYKLFEDACRAVGLQYGQVKGDSILDDNGEFYIMEVAPRLHGPLGSIYLIPNVLDINPFVELIRFNLGKEVKTHNPNIKHSRSIKVEALEEKPKEKNGNTIKILEKSGIADRNQWNSNNDVPVYIVRFNEDG